MYNYVYELISQSWPSYDTGTIIIFFLHVKRLRYRRFIHQSKGSGDGTARVQTQANWYESMLKTRNQPGFGFVF